MESSTEALDNTLVLFERGDARASPAPLARKLTEYRPSSSGWRTRRSAEGLVLARVGAVVRSTPAKGLPMSAACFARAGTFVRLGVKLQYGVRVRFAA